MRGDVCRIIFGLLSFMMWYASVFTTKRIIQRGGLNIKHWPKRYIMPNGKIRRIRLQLCEEKEESN